MNEGVKNVSESENSFKKDNNVQKEENEDEEDSSSESDNECQDFSVVDITHKTMPASVVVDNSKDVHVGTRLNYNGPVTINQYLDSSAILPDVTMVHGAKLPRPLCPKPEMEEAEQRRWVRERIAWVCICVSLVLFLILGVVLYFVVFQKSSDVDSQPIKYVGAESTRLKGEHYIYSRVAWQGLPPKGPIPSRLRPASLVVISSNEGDSCSDFPTCSAEMMSTQEYDMHERPQGTYPDIAYNFMVGGDGNVYEGRGWDKQSYLPFAEEILSIGFIGQYNPWRDGQQLNKRQINATQELINRGVQLNKIKPDYKLIGENQVRNTNSPGKNVIDVILNWPHWDPTFRVARTFR